MSDNRTSRSAARRQFPLLLGRFGLVTPVLVMLVAPGPAQTAVRVTGILALDSRLVTARDWVQVAAGSGFTVSRRTNGTVVVWGNNVFGTASVPALPGGVTYSDVQTLASHVAALRSDGSLVVWGRDVFGVGSVPALGPGLRYTRVAAGFNHVVSLRSDGTADAWGQNLFGETSVTPLPAGTVYVEVAAGSHFSAGLRSDGSIAVWGRLAPAPQLPAGTSYTDLDAGLSHAVALRSDGAAVAWGSNTHGQLSVPPLPAGTVYTALESGQDHCLALRSDGIVVAWGRNDRGQLVVPPLPSGLGYQGLAAGSHSAALRSDGAIVTWGNFVDNPDPAPPGTDYVQAAGGINHLVTLLDNGQIVCFGSDDRGQCTVPALPPGVTYTGVGAGHYLSAAVLSNGTAAVWGDPFYGQTSVPPLAPGVTYTALSVGLTHILGLRSDGTVAAWGGNQFNQASVPALPPGTTYVQIAAGAFHNVGLRSDGVLVAWGRSPSGETAVPQTPLGLEFVEIAPLAARLSDGSIVGWGTLTNNVIPPSPGVSYVEVRGGVSSAVVARRSDGTAVLFHGGIAEELPAAGAGASHLHLSYSSALVVALVGAETSYVTFGAGCAGTLPASRLVPTDTPRIGRALEVRLFDLPVDLALMTTGLSNTMSTQGPLPASAAPFGMPGCTAFIRSDVFELVVGSGGQGVSRTAIPANAMLLGLPFYQHAVVIDPGAGNPLGAVLSDATAGVVGL